MRTVGIVVLAAVLVVRAASTYTVFNDTVDEGVHLAAGLEVLQKGSYTVDNYHPPLARIVLAGLPYLAGLRVGESNSLWAAGGWAAASEDFYWRSLVLARAGNLLFALLALVIVCVWAADLFGIRAGLLAGVLVISSPKLLAHASLATTDMAGAAGVIATAYCFWRWTREPRWRWCLASAGSFSLAILSKFSALFYLPPAMGLFLLLAAWDRRHTGNPGRAASFRKEVAAQVVVFGLLVWLSLQALHAFPVFRGEGIPVMYRAGLSAVLKMNTLPTHAYLLGHYSETGWWYYFPVALAVKSTLPLLLLAALAFALWSVRRYSAGATGILYPLVAAGTILAVAMQSRINIGVRHVLSIECLLAIVAGGVFARRELLKGRTPAVLGLGLLLAGWHVSESIQAHPDYLAYFNQIARGREERFLLDSNLDWGQDLARLALYARANQITQPMHLLYFGATPPERLGLRAVQLYPEHPQPGWSAVSVQYAVELLSRPTGAQWMRDRPPDARVGKSIWIYRLSEAP